MLKFIIDGSLGLELRLLIVDVLEIEFEFGLVGRAMMKHLISDIRFELEAF